MTPKFLMRPLALFLGLLCCTGFQCSRKSDVKTSIVLKVNDRELTAEDFAERLAKRLAKYDAVSIKNPLVVQTNKTAIVEEFIHSVIVEDWAHENKVAVSSKELDAEVDKFRSQYPNDIALKQALADANLSFSEWRNALKKNLLDRKLFDSLKIKAAAPDDEDLHSYYNSHRDEFRKKASIRLRQVVVPNQDEAQRLDSLLTAKKATLSDLAQKYSVTPEGKSGGDTGWIIKGTLDIFDQAFSWPIGKRSPVLKSPYGFHVFEVIAKQSESQLNFESVRANIQRLLRADREQAIYMSWLEEQLKKSHVLRNDELINSISVTTKGEK